MYDSNGLLTARAIPGSLGDRMRTSTSLFTFLLLTIVAATIWAFWPDAPPRPPISDSERVTGAAAEAAGAPAAVDRQPVAQAQPNQDNRAAPGGESISENNPSHRPIIEIRGLVRDAVSSVGIEAAKIVHLRSDRAAITSDDGTFLLRLPIDEDGAVLLVSHPGYAKRHVQIQPGDCCDATVELRIDLQPSQLLGQITGQVFDAERQPLAGCRVELLATMRDSHLATKAVATDREGRFQILDVPPGTQRIAVRADHHDDHVINGIDLEPRMVHDVGAITLQRFWWGSVRGQIVDDGGKAIRNIEVLAHTGKDDHGTARGRSDANGTFHLPRVAPGNVTLRFDCRGDWSGSRSFELQPRQTSTQNVRMPVGTNFVGGQVLVGGEPAYGYSADCEVSADELAAYDLDSFYRSVPVGKDGRFRLNGLLGKHVRLSFTRARPWVSEGTDNPVATNSLDHIFLFESKIGSTRVSGVVLDRLGTPIAGVDVHPYDLHAKSARGITGANGHYQLVVATTVHSSTALHATHPDFSTATHNLPSWDTKECQIDFVLHANKNAAELTVRAHHEGSPIARALVFVRTEHGRFVARGTTDARGQQIFSLGEGSWRLQVRHPGFVTSDQVMQLASNEQRNLDVALASQPRYSRILEVRSVPDQPLANVTVTAWQKGAWVASSKTNHLGQATLRELPSGDIVFSVQPAGHARHELPQSVQWEQAEAVVFRIRPGLQAIAGTVYLADSSPAAFCELSCESAPASNENVHVYVTTDREGRFRIEHLVAGSYELQAFVGTSTVKQTATTGDTPVVLRAE